MDLAQPGRDDRKEEWKGGGGCAWVWPGWSEDDQVKRMILLILGVPRWMILWILRQWSWEMTWWLRWLIWWDRFNEICGWIFLCWLTTWVMLADHLCSGMYLVHTVLRYYGTIIYCQWCRYVCIKTRNDVGRYVPKLRVHRKNWPLPTNWYSMLSKNYEISSQQIRENFGFMAPKLKKWNQVYSLNGESHVLKPSWL